MLNLSSLEFLLAEAFSGLKRNRVMALAAILTAAVSLAISAAFGVCALATHRACERLPQQFDMAVYVKREASEGQVRDVGRRLRMLPYVDNVEFISREEGWKEFRKQLGTEISTQDVLYNPALDTYRVSLSHPEQSDSVQKAISKLPCVDSVDWRQKEVVFFTGLSRVVSAAGLMTMIVLFAGSVFIIGNTIRLGIYARRREVAIMRIVGARASFIRLPFLLEGMLISGTGALLALLLMRFAANYLSQVTRGFQSVTRFFDSGISYWQLSAVLIGVGLSLGAFSSSMSIRRYLREGSLEKGQR